MTIVVAVASPGAIALAADSRTTQREGAHHRVASDSAHKVFDIGGGIGVATYGLGTIGSRTIAALIDEWETTRPPTRLQKAADSLGEFFQARLDEATPTRRGELTRLLPRTWPLGFLVVGCERGAEGRVLEVKVEPGRFEVVEQRITPVLYRGQAGALRRLIAGVDFEELRGANIRVDGDLGDRLSTLHYELIAPLTAQDAVDLAFFLVETTIHMQRFSDGTIASRSMSGLGEVPGCGGPVQGIVVRPGRVDWISRNGLKAPRSGAHAEISPF